MPGQPRQKSVVRTALLVIAAALAVAVGACANGRCADQEREREASGLYVFETGEYRYEYHAPSDTEALFDLRRDPRGLVNVVRDHRHVADACRTAASAKAGVADLAELTTRHAADVQRLRALGYL